MRAVRVEKVEKGKPSGFFKAHWLRDTDEERTVCGLLVGALTHAEVVDVEHLPSVEACLACERAREGYTTRSPVGGRRVVLQPSLGYFSPQHGRGHRIQR